jgi:2-polyprenyl-6-hydroxyphenyl methylase/3-demethylubiquinone-9 3-methyltransferase
MRRNYLACRRKRKLIYSRANNNFIYSADLSNFILEHTLEKNNISNQVDNTIYDQYGDKWYTADDDPIALLRQESKIKVPWVIEKIKSNLKFTTQIKVLDVGCGGGFLSNPLAKAGYLVTGVDTSKESLRVAQTYDTTNSVIYLEADAYKLPFPDQSFDVVTAMDFLEHVEHPELVIKEVSRLLKPNGLFIFHTFNRNILAYFVVIKFVEWFVKNTKKNLHILRLFIKPSELK